MIRFENVTKTYPGQERPALDSVNLEIVKGEFVFLVVHQVQVSQHSCV